MRQLGISIYPDKSTIEEIYHYIDQAADIGFSRIFSCLLSVDKPKEEIKNQFKQINQYAHNKDFEIITDVAPSVFDKLDISYQDLSFFKEIETDGIRLDIGFTGYEEALMTFNPYKIKIEINMSNMTHTIDTIMDYQPNPYLLMACHNFYPHEYSGLSLDYFKKCTQNFRKYGLRTAAFVSSQTKDTFGPWPVTQGLVTLEMHRHLSLSTQVKHIVSLSDIDDIIISNCYPSQEELADIKDLPLDHVCFDCELLPDLSDVEKTIVLDALHVNRGDVNAYMIRSTQSRIKYKNHYFPLHHAPEFIHRGDIIIESSEYGHYAGEMQIALQDMANRGKSNVVGCIKAEEHFLLDELKPWQKFSIRLNKKV